MITIEYHTTASAYMRTNGQGLLDHSSACTAFLTGVLGWDCDHFDLMQSTIAPYPLEEDPPTCIVDRLCQLTVTYHVLNLKVFIGNQVARRDVRVCCLTSKILTLPLHSQVLLGKCLSGFLAVSRFLLLTGETPLQTCKLLFSFAVVSRVRDCVDLQSQSGTL